MSTANHDLGIRLSKVGRGAFEQAVCEAAAGDVLSAELIDAMLKARAALWKEYCRLLELLVKFVACSVLARRLMAIPGVGLVTALSLISAIDDPSRFRRSRDVVAYFGLTSRRYEAASAVMTRFRGKDKLKAWGEALAKRGCHRKATVAVGRKLAVIMHAMWSDGTVYQGRPPTEVATADTPPGEGDAHSGRAAMSREER